MRKLTISAIALLSFATSFAQTGNSYGPLLSGGVDPPMWPTQLEGIHISHIRNPNSPLYGRLVLWGHGLPDTNNPDDAKGTQAFVYDTNLGQFIDHLGAPNYGRVPQFFLPEINMFCAGHNGDKDGDLFVVGGEVDGHSGPRHQEDR